MLDFSGLTREKGCRVYRLELLDIDSDLSYQGLSEIPFLKITNYALLRTLTGLGGMDNKIIILKLITNASQWTVTGNDFITRKMFANMDLTLTSV
jgi:hypothetical protein